MIIMISNALTPHQIPLCDALYNLNKNEFQFFEVEGISLERKRMGWKDQKRSYLKRINDFSNNEWLKIVNSADAVILGSAHEKYISTRLRQKKLVLRYSERFYKGNMNIFKWVRAYIGNIIHHRRYQNKNHILLCAGAYTAGDAALFGNYINKSYKWGYFPQLHFENIEKIMINRRSHSRISILWVGRLIALKHPEDAIKIAYRLKESGYIFNLNIIGTGEMKSKLYQMVRKKNLEDFIRILG